MKLWEKYSGVWFNPLLLISGKEVDFYYRLSFLLENDWKECFFMHPALSCLDFILNDGFCIEIRFLQQGVKKWTVYIIISLLNGKTA